MYVYGPVNSRRLGGSLGIDLTPKRVCSVDCIYCEEASPTATLTIQRDDYAPVTAVIDEVKAKANPKLDYLTFSGAGEPTLHKGIAQVIQGIKPLGIPIAVLTNSTLLHLPQVREDISKADLVIPSLDAVSEEVFKLVNRPCKEISAALVVEGLKAFASEFQGCIWLEVLLVKGINDSEQEVMAMAQVANNMRIDKVQLNTVSRATTVKGVEPVDYERMVQLSLYFKAPVEIYI